jgi:glycine dehydrogenase subunit 2
LRKYLPGPWVVKDGESFAIREDCPASVGRVRSFFGNFGVLVRAYTYILSLGGDGLEEASRMALLNANYIRRKLEKTYQIAFNEPCMHECIFTDRLQHHHDVSTLDIAKRLLDYGFHPPTIYFPLVVSGALMIEPTETETPETLDAFVDSMIAIAQEAKETPEVVKTAPHSTPVSRLDEARAARKPILSWQPPAAKEEPAEARGYGMKR